MEWRLYTWSSWPPACTCNNARTPGPGPALPCCAGTWCCSVAPALGLRQESDLSVPETGHQSHLTATGLAGSLLQATSPQGCKMVGSCLEGKAVATPLTASLEAKAPTAHTPLSSPSQGEADTVPSSLLPSGKPKGTSLGNLHQQRRRKASHSWKPFKSRLF